MTPHVSILILNWNGWEDTIECLESLYQINYPNYTVIVVDNDSKDDSVNKIKEYCKGEIKVESEFFKYYPGNKPIEVYEFTEEETKGLKVDEEFLKSSSNEKLVLLVNSENYGFAEGNNIGIRYVLNTFNSDYILLLNNDTVVEENFLNSLVKVAENDAEIGILGPKIYYYDFQGKTDVIANLGGKIDLSKYPGYYDLIETNDFQNYNECNRV